jgi:hypothetical protein
VLTTRSEFDISVAATLVAVNAMNQCKIRNHTDPIGANGTKIEIVTAQKRV